MEVILDENELIEKLEKSYMQGLNDGLSKRNEINGDMVKLTKNEYNEDIEKACKEGFERGKLEGCTKKVEYDKDADTAYKSITDEEILEQLKEKAVDEVTAKISSQIIDLVSDAMRTIESDFQCSKLIRDTYEAKRTDQTLKDDFEKSLKFCIEPQQTLKSDFMNQWVNEMMEKQAKQINMSVINEGLCLKKKFIEFLQSLNFKSNIFDVYSTIERKINELKEDIEFSEGFLKDIKNIL